MGHFLEDEEIGFVLVLSLYTDKDICYMYLHEIILQCLSNIYAEH